MTRPNTVSDFVSLIGEPTDEGCWPWANKLDKGYGRFNMNGKTRLAHSMAYVLFGGFIADGLTLDHTCHNGSGCEDGVECRHRRCVNPAHLEPVPQQVNTLRGETVPGRYARQECCKHGHRYDVTGFRLDSRGARLCVQCIADRNEMRGDEPPQISVDADGDGVAEESSLGDVELVAYARNVCAYAGGRTVWIYGKRYCYFGGGGSSW